MPELSCLVCGHHGQNPLWGFLLKCPNCGFITACPEPTIDARTLYNGDYFTGQEYLNYREDEKLFRRNFRKRLRDILTYTTSGRLLEIGSAYGFFLDLAKTRFDVTGFELNQDAAAYGRDRFGLDIRTSDFLETSTSDLDPPYDVVTLWDVVEHLERPDQVIARIAELTKPGSLLCITTGDIGSSLARLRGRKWRMIHPPSHLHYFDRQTLPRLLANHGYQTINIRSVGVARSVRQILYSVLSLGLKMPRAYAACRRLVPAGIGFTFNTFDIMQVIARRV